MNVKVVNVQLQPRILPFHLRRIRFITHSLRCEEVTCAGMSVAIPLLIVQDERFFKAVADACSIMEEDGYKSATLYVMNNPCRLGFAAVKD